MIVKIQRPIMPPPPEGEALIYDKRRTVEGQVPFADVAAILGDDLKCYAAATYVRATGQIILHERVVDQDW